MNAQTMLSAKVVYPAMAALLVTVMIGWQYCSFTVRDAPDFSLPVVAEDGHSGDRMRLADQRGKVVLIDFWATWCGPCQASTPGLVRLAQRYANRGLIVIGINVDDDGPGTVPSFMRHFGVTYPVLYDSGGSVQNQYNVQALPTAVLIDRQGRIRLFHQGATDEADMASQIERLL